MHAPEPIRWLIAGLASPWLALGVDAVHFTKGFYLTIPFDVFFVHSTTKKGRLSWSPLTRDGGQPLMRRYEPYGLYD